MKNIEHSKKQITKFSKSLPYRISRDLRCNQGLIGYRLKQRRRLEGSRIAPKLSAEVPSCVKLLIYQEFNPHWMVDYPRRTGNLFTGPIIDNAELMLAKRNVLDISPKFFKTYAALGDNINENTNELITLYFLKKADSTTIADKGTQLVMDMMNNRPRASHGYKSPNKLLMGQRVNLLTASSITLPI